MKAKAILSKKKRLLLAAAAVAGAVICALAAGGFSAADEVTYSEAEVEAVTMEQTLTAAGEIKASSSEEIEFSTARYFAGMCVEEGDAVREGQHLISYTDGTYTDAPDDGVVTEIKAPDTGDAADEDSTLTLNYTDQMVLEVSVPEDDIGKLEKGDEATICVNADPGKTYQGTITSVKAISADLLSSSGDGSEEEEAEDSSEESDKADETEGSSGDSESGTAYYTVKIGLTNDGSLKTGMSGNCTITVSSRKSVLAVPIEAVGFDEDDTAYVNVTDGGEVTKKKVTTGESDADYVEISEGLSAGDKVQIEVRK